MTLDDIANPGPEGFYRFYRLRDVPAPEYVRKWEHGRWHFGTWQVQTQVDEPEAPVPNDMMAEWPSLYSHFRFEANLDGTPGTLPPKQVQTQMELF